MSSEQYLAYIAHFISNVAPLTPKHGLREYLEKEIGTTDVLGASDEDIKKLARHLYKSSVLANYSRHGSFTIAKHLSDKQIEEYLTTEIALGKKYKLDYETVDTDLSSKSVDSHIKKNGETKFKSILAKVNVKTSPTTIKNKAAAEREVKKKTTTKKVVKKSPVKKSPVKKTTTTTKKTTKKSPEVKKASSKKCSEYNVKELKEMAKAKGKSGYSKMNKDDLCKLLKL